MQRQEQVVGDTFVYRFTGENPKYALVISHGLGGHGGIYDQFCAYHAAQGVDIWSYDAPGHGRSATPRRRPRGGVPAMGLGAARIRPPRGGRTGLRG